MLTNNLKQRPPHQRELQWMTIVGLLLALLVPAVPIDCLQSLSQRQTSPNPWLLGNLQRSLSESSLSKNNSILKRNFQPHLRHLQRHQSLERVRGTTGEHCSNNYNFDYVQLTLMWAPGTCSTSPQQCRRIQNEHFTIHGMWPTRSGTREPANCCFDNSFYFEELKSILPDLNEYWYSYFDDSSLSFWSHEWLKHGTCSRDIPDLVGELRYFGTTLKLANSMPILKVLADAGVVPNKQDKPYQSDIILKAITHEITHGKSFIIECDYEHNQAIPVLTGLSFCFDKNLKFTDCPRTKDKCKRQLLFRS